MVESGRFDWDNGRFPRMTEPVASYGGLRFWDNFGEYGFCTMLRVEQLRDFGTCLAPLNAFLFLQGLETLSLRMDAHVANAVALARHLSEHPAVAWVSYAGLPASPHHDLAQRYLPNGPGAVFSFGVKGGRDAGRSVRRGGRAGQPPGQRRRHPHARHPSRVHHPPAAVRRGSPGRRRGPRPRPGFGRHRGPRRHHLGLRPGPRTRKAPTNGGSGSTEWRQPPSARERLAILQQARTIAIVGASSKPSRASYFVATYLLSSSTDYTVWFVNPGETSILGHPVYPSLAALPERAGPRRRLPRGPKISLAWRKDAVEVKATHLLGPARPVERRGRRDRPSAPVSTW